MGSPRVDYELVIYDSLPPPAVRHGGKSILDEQLRRIVGAPEAWGRPVRIGLYSVGQAASAAKRVLQQRHTDRAVWAFHTRLVPASTRPNAAMLRGLFAIYTPPARPASVVAPQAPQTPVGVSQPV